MKINIVNKMQVLGEQALEQARSKTLSSFSRFGENVLGIEINVQDINGPRGGVDKVCRVIVKLKRLNNITITSRDVSLSKALHGAINRASRAVARQIDRRAVQAGPRPWHAV